MLGVGKGTVERDLKSAPNGAKRKQKPALIKEKSDDPAPNGAMPPPVITQSGAHAAKESAG